ncbi:hypothetical protein RFI_28342 [Reticulomyxa filosa]|uniref:Uncharacterized protein n=1 Tax=Reticulomyxa filosa TaxID=46433 RepID=X6M561_RETFI|nr:hypothetical protein RFI_28342 [Reticulomyxa filosa]|eukprot:ETO09044.1 hypothetical protein RFI_28342 [Reticulomyxa filosa]
MRSITYIIFSYWFDAYPVIEFIQNVFVPVWIIHGARDEQIKVIHGEMLARVAPNAVEPLSLKTLHIHIYMYMYIWFVEGADHNNIELLCREELFARLESFLQYLQMQEKEQLIPEEWIDTDGPENAFGQGQPKTNEKTVVNESNDVETTDESTQLMAMEKPPSISPAKTDTITAIRVDASPQNPDQPMSTMNHDDLTIKHENNNTKANANEQQRRPQHTDNHPVPPAKKLLPPVLKPYNQTTVLQDIIPTKKQDFIQCVINNRERVRHLNLESVTKFYNDHRSHVYVHEDDDLLLEEQKEREKERERAREREREEEQQLELNNKKRKTKLHETA